MEQPGQQPLWPTGPAPKAAPVKGGPLGQRARAAWPAWSLIGPALGGLLGVAVLTMTIGAERYMLLQFHLTLVFYAVLVVVYLVAAVGGAVAGLLVGRRWPAAFGIPATVIMVVGLASSFLAFSPGMLAVGLVLAGLGGGAAAGTVAGLLPMLGGRRQRATLGLAGLAVLALVLGLAIGYLLPRSLSWRIPYGLAIPFAVIAVLVTAAGAVVRMVSKPGR